MRAYFNMPIPDFVDQLRDIAIRAGARPQVLAMFDDLAMVQSPDEVEDAVEAAGTKAYDEGWDEGYKDGKQEQYNQMMDALSDLLHKHVPADIAKDIKIALDKLNPEDSK